MAHETHSPIFSSLLYVPLFCSLTPTCISIYLAQPNTCLAQSNSNQVSGRAPQVRAKKGDETGGGKRGWRWRAQTNRSRGTCDKTARAASVVGPSREYQPSPRWFGSESSKEAGPVKNKEVVRYDADEAD